MITFYMVGDLYKIVVVSSVSF